MSDDNTPKFTIYDTTLRDGAQKANVKITRQEKFLIFKRLVEDLSVPLIEVYPFSNIKDRKLIELVKERMPDHLDKLVVFGSTRRSDKTVEEDANLQAIVDQIANGIQHATIFGKSWLFQLEFIHATPEQNIEMIIDSIKYLKSKGLSVYYDAEHFFDGFKSNPDYALETLKAAASAGADCLVLCDTNGGLLPNELRDIMEKVINNVDIPLGLHTHNDSGLAVALALEAVNVCRSHGRSLQIQGTINGLGERIGNMNLCTLIPILSLKMGVNLEPKPNIVNLKPVSDFMYEILNISIPDDNPFVGNSAFTHKGGMHIAAVNKNVASYEHINPVLVGNKRKFMVSEMAGRAALYKKMKKMGIKIEKDNPIIPEILKVLKRKESHGYTYEGAEASLEILIRGMMYDLEQESYYYRRYFFEVDYFRVITDVRNVFSKKKLQINTDANIRLEIAEKDGFHEFHTAASGNGPVNAIDSALKKAILHFYPVLDEIKLIDFKVRIANEENNEFGTASRVRVLVQTEDKDGQIWGTIGSNVNIIVASFLALIDSYVYKLMKEDLPPYISE